MWVRGSGGGSGRGGDGVTAETLERCVIGGAAEVLEAVDGCKGDGAMGRSSATGAAADAKASGTAGTANDSCWVNRA